jgi:hypothetical protein
MAKQKPKYRSTTFSITFGDRAENHVGMQMIGTLAPEGFSHADLLAAQAKLEGYGVATELVALHDNLPAEHVIPGLESWILIGRNAAAAILASSSSMEGEEGGEAADEADGAAVGSAGTADDLYREQMALTVDKKAKMRGRVVNKHARWNVCYGAASQEPDYEAGKGRVVAFAEVPLVGKLRANLPLIAGPKAEGLQGELNKYYDVAQCGIGFHGDSERKLVACFRLGASTPLHYQWFVRSASVGERVKLTLHHGDFYMMSEKATGFDWKKKIIPTLRHAAGAHKFLVIKK